MWRRDERWIEVAEGSGPVWAEWALFFSFPQRRRSSLDPLHNQQPSRLEDARSGQDKQHP